MSKPYTMRDLWSIYAPIDSPTCTVDKARLYATVEALDAQCANDQSRDALMRVAKATYEAAQHAIVLMSCTCHRLIEKHVDLEKIVKEVAP